MGHQEGREKDFERGFGVLLRWFHDLPIWLCGMKIWYAVVYFCFILHNKIVCEKSSMVARNKTSQKDMIFENESDMGLLSARYEKTCLSIATISTIRTFKTSKRCTCPYIQVYWLIFKLICIELKRFDTFTRFSAKNILASWIKESATKFVFKVVVALTTMVGEKCERRAV